MIREERRNKREERGGGEAEAVAGRMHGRDSCRRTGGRAAQTTRWFWKPRAGGRGDFGERMGGEKGGTGRRTGI